MIYSQLYSQYVIINIIGNKVGEKVGNKKGFKSTKAKNYFGNEEQSEHYNCGASCHTGRE